MKFKFRSLLKAVLLVIGAAFFIGCNDDNCVQNPIDLTEYTQQVILLQASADSLVNVQKFVEQGMSDREKTYCTNLAKKSKLDGQKIAIEQILKMINK